MRLEKLTIGSPLNSPTHQYKNLKDVTIDFDQNHWVTVVIGWNGTGKSNVLEALAIIFRDFIAKRKVPAFAFQLHYRIGAGDALRQVYIDADPDRKNEVYLIRVANAEQIRQSRLLNGLLDFGGDTSAESQGIPVRLAAFLNADAEYLPRYVFSYYSGESRRMYEVFRSYAETYDSKLRNGDDPGSKRLFYAMPVHSQFVLLAFLTQQSDVVREFLDNHLGIDPDEGIESVLFVLRQPPWKSKAADGDPRFWNARGVVRDFLSRLYDIALAPVDISRRVPTSIWNTEILQFKYLYVKNIAALRTLVGNQAPARFFRDLESTYVSELIEEVRIRVRLKKNNGSVVFRELSEGEMQLLTVLGLLRFTAENESLFLLDEPDTHLNPQWCISYLRYLENFVGEENQGSSHVVLTTHNPLSIAELAKEQVQILEPNVNNGAIHAKNPNFNPRGMGVAGLLTSDMFKLESSLDKVTQGALETEASLSRKELLNDHDKQLLAEAREVIDEAGFQQTALDPLMEEYFRARYELVNGERAKETGLSDHPGSPRRRKIARKLLMRTLGLGSEGQSGNENDTNSKT